MAKSSNIDLQPITRRQLQSVINQLQGNNAVQDERLNNIGLIKVKMPLIKRFNGTKSKLKEFLMQIQMKVQSKGLKLLILADTVVYIRLFLTKEPLKWFKSYFLEF